MTEREALKLALEALENVYGKGKRCEAAIAAIKQVLAQPEQEHDDERIAALRTLDYCHGLKAGWNFCAADDDAGFDRAIAGTSEAVRVLKGKPAQPEQEPVCWKHYDEPKKGCAWCDKQPAQQEHVATSDTSEKRVDEMAKQRHEPVAYGMWDTMLGKGHRMMMVRLDKGQDGCTVPLYPPPQRTWVGLTGFEQKELMAMSARDAVFATEAKLKEKNT